MQCKALEVFNPFDKMYQRTFFRPCLTLPMKEAFLSTDFNLKNKKLRKHQDDALKQEPSLLSC
jgi:hypothetical protein